MLAGSKLATTERLLVTGTSGFVGSTLCTYLEGRGWQVHKGKANFGRGLELPLDGWLGWSQEVQGCNAVIHLAARTHVDDCKGVNDWAFELVNTEWTLNFARS